MNSPRSADSIWSVFLASARASDGRGVAAGGYGDRRCAARDGRAGRVDRAPARGGPTDQFERLPGRVDRFAVGNVLRVRKRRAYDGPATTTLTLEFPKLALLLPEGGEAAGEVVVLPIGLSEEYMDRAESLYFYTDAAAAARLPLSRPKFAHKGNCGHALLVCGSEDMAGAAVLATGAALRSGCGLVTVHLPRSERVSVHANSPSAIVSGDPEPVFSRLPRDMGRYDAVGVGPGVGQDPRSFEALEALLRAGLPAVIDADALNMLSARTELQRLVARGSILTPHLGELRRLAGDWASEDEKIEKTRDLASRLGCCVVVKGAHTMVCSSDGRCFFNSSGNPGMAKGGSGDVLTGFLAGLLARGYEPLAAAILGVYLHGRAGDRAADYYGQEAMNAGDLIDFLSEAQQEILGRDNG